MPTLLIPTSIPMAGGITAATGVGQDTLIDFSGAWVTGDQYTIIFTDGPTGTQTQVGAGFVTGVGEAIGNAATYAFTFQQKVYVLSGPSVFFSAEGSSTIWNDPNGTGNGFVSMTDNYGTPENLVAMAAFQGRLAFFSRNTTQIWQVTENPANWAQQQVLDNTGTLASESVKSVGDFDVFFLADNGIRSLRVLNISLNAYVDDLGSPIDQLITTALSVLTPAQIASCTGIVEPTRKRYWLFIPNAANDSGQLFVYSGFRSSKVAAWSTYTPSYASPITPLFQSNFVPQNFVVLQGIVFTRDGDKIYAYGSPVDATNVPQALYDSAVATITSPYMDLKKPVENKKCRGVDFVAFGDFTTVPATPSQWKVSASQDPISGTFEDVVVQTGTGADPSATVNPTNPAIQATNNSGSFPYNDRGTHFAFQAVTTGIGSAVFSEIVFRYNDANEKN